MKIYLHRIINFSSPWLSVILVFLILSLLVPFALRFTQQQQQQQGNLNSIQIENQLPGTTAWRLTRPAYFDPKTFHSLPIEGYASTTSAKTGDVVNFFVNTTESYFTADVYRLGWYQGKGGRLVQSLPHIPGHSYPLPRMDAQTGLVDTSWPVAFTLKINTAWVSGEYMIKLTASNGYQSYISLVIRSLESSNFAFIHAVNTDEAYNYWGGASLYVDLTHTLKAGRAYKVSFDRPFQYGFGAGYFFRWEYPMVRWLERRGYDVSYFSDIDLQSNPIALEHHRALLVVGHSEYWSKVMRDNLEALINKGENVAFFSANDIFWQIRYEPRPGNGQFISARLIVCYKDKITDPLYGRENSLVTVEFRASPVNQPEQPLLGATSEGWWDPSQPGFPWVVSDASSWVFAGTDFKNGESLPGLVGFEYDKVDTRYPTPPGLDILSASPIVDHFEKHDVSNSTLYTALSGARVFDAGTFQWSWGLDSFSLIKRADVESQAIQQITDNILRNFSSRS